MKVAILCGGLGTRLGELTKNVPKPMIEIGGRPYLERVVESFRNRGFRDFVMLTGYLPHVIESHFGDGSRFDVSIEYSVETTPLGTGGALREARHLLTDRFLMTFGDVLRYYHYDHFVSAHERNCLAVYPARSNPSPRSAGRRWREAPDEGRQLPEVLRPSPQPSPRRGGERELSKGNVELDGPLIGRFDKHTAEELPYLDAGFSVMERSTIDYLPTEGACSFEEIVYSGLAQQGQLEAEIVDHDFFDIGTPEELERTREILERA